MAKGQVQRMYLDWAESTSLRAMLPPVGGTTRCQQPAVQALLSASASGESVADYFTGSGVAHYC